MSKKLLLSILLITLVALSFVKIIDQTSSEQLDKALTRSVTVFAIARGINGLLSVVQGTEIYATPAGIGFNVAVGEIVDPMNDMVERFSWIMLMSSISLGIQEILLHFGSSEFTQLLFSISVASVLAVLWIPKLWHKASFNLIFKGLIIFSFLRFLVPIIVVINEGIYTFGMQTQFEEAKTGLELNQEQNETLILQLQKSQKQENASWLDTLDVSAQLDSYKQKMTIFWKNLKQSFDSAIDYMLSLIVIFIMQSILLPLISLRLALILFKKMMSLDLATLIGVNGIYPLKLNSNRSTD